MTHWRDVDALREQRRERGKSNGAKMVQILNVWSLASLNSNYSQQRDSLERKAEFLGSFRPNVSDSEGQRACAHTSLMAGW